MLRPINQELSDVRCAEVFSLPEFDDARFMILFRDPSPSFSDTQLSFGLLFLQTQLGFLSAPEESRLIYIYKSIREPLQIK